MVTSSVEFWRGSVNGSPVVAIATNIVRPSKNRKTGDMVQTYILRADMKPIEAVVNGDDRAVCGDCPLRPSVATGAKCYVNTGWLTRLWDSWNNGNVPTITPNALGDIVEATGKPVRQGAYGDPAVVPVSVWDEVDRGRGTSYSHQWRTSQIQAYAMASVQGLDEAHEAQAAGYRTYRVDVEQVGAQDGEIMCPAESRGVSCADCGLCSGNRSGAKNIVIDPIGKFVR